MIELNNSLKENSMKTRVMSQIGDSITIDVAPGEHEEVKGIVDSVMINYLSRTVRRSSVMEHM